MMVGMCLAPLSSVAFQISSGWPQEARAGNRSPVNRDYVLDYNRVGSRAGSLKLCPNVRGSMARYFQNLAFYMQFYG